MDASAFAYRITGEEEGIDLKNASLILESNTTIRITFQLTGDNTIDAYTFTIDGEEVTPIDRGDGKYAVELTGIGPRFLDEMHTFSVGGLSLSYCGLSYVNRVMSGEQDQILIDVAKTLYAYYAAAEAVFQ